MTTVQRSPMRSRTLRVEQSASKTPRGASVPHADFDDGASLDGAFAGADKILIISTDLLDIDGGRRLKQQETAVAAAKKAGAKHVAYTSMLRPEQSPVLIANDHYGTEQALKASGLCYTIFRNNAYFENLLLFLPNILATGRWFTSAGNGRVAHAARDDMAAAIAGRFASNSTDSAILELTGPKAYSNAEVAELVTEVTRKPIEIVQVSDDALIDGLKAAGFPLPMARLFASVDANIRAGNSDVVNNTIEEHSRRMPMSLKQFLEANKAALAG
jgi:NAD(P)H dehydrogenase (quinone)